MRWGRFSILVSVLSDDVTKKESLQHQVHLSEACLILKVAARNCLLFYVMRPTGGPSRKPRSIHFVVVVTRNFVQGQSSPSTFTSGQTKYYFVV